MKACKNAKKYRGLYPPKCDGGIGCDACREKYMNKKMREYQEASDRLFEDLIMYGECNYGKFMPK